MMDTTDHQEPETPLVTQEQHQFTTRAHVAASQAAEAVGGEGLLARVSGWRSAACFRSSWHAQGGHASAGKLLERRINRSMDPSLSCRLTRSNGQPLLTVSTRSQNA